MAEAEWLLREKGQPEHASLSSHHAVEHCYGNGLDEREQRTVPGSGEALGVRRAECAISHKHSTEPETSLMEERHPHAKNLAAGRNFQSPSRGPSFKDKLLQPTVQQVNSKASRHHSNPAS